MSSIIRTSIFILGLILGGSFAVHAQTAPRETVGEFIDDATITTKVKAAILGDPSLKVLDIHVTTYKNVVQLSGFVDSRAAINRSGELANGISGVSSVRNDLILK